MTRWEARLEKAQLISFDVFDTLLIRRVLTPADVFHLVQARYEQTHPPLGLDYYALRRQAELTAREEAFAQGESDDITFPAIFKVMGRTLPPDVCDTLMALEWELEQAVCARNPRVAPLYEAAQRLGKPIAILSDMYLSADQLATLLTQAGYTGYDYLLVSGETGQMKATGRAFQQLITLSGCPAKDILHVGDNRHADIEQAQRQGIRTLFVPKRLDTHGGHLPRPHTGGASWVMQTQLHAPRLLFWERLGYTVAGPLYLGFAQWLHSQLQAHDHAYFLARDGHIMQAVYQWLGSVLGQSQPNTYLLLSRRVLNIPLLVNGVDDNLPYLLGKTTGLPVEHFLRRAGLTPEAHSQAVQHAGFSGLTHRVDLIQDADALKALLHQLEGPILDNAARERAALLRYLEQAGLPNTQQAAMIDIGWHGTLQHTLGRLLAQAGWNVNVDGYYLGTFPPARDFQQPMRAYLFANGEPAPTCDVIKQCVELFEFLHLAPHGSVVRFGPDGQAQLDDDCAPTRQKAFAGVRAGAFAFLEAVRPLLPQVPPLTPDEALAPMTRLLTQPTLQEARLLGELPHVFDHFEPPRPIARPPRNPAQQDAARSRAYWKTGYDVRRAHLNGVPLGQPLPSRFQTPYFQQAWQAFVKRAGGQRVVLYGAGLLCQEFVEQVDLYALNVVGVIDRNPAKAGQPLGPYTVSGLDDLPQLNPTLLLVTVPNNHAVVMFLTDWLKAHGLQIPIEHRLLD
jgi:HAD superfamily hydrolase (TIGR01549 family)